MKLNKLPMNVKPHFLAGVWCLVPMEQTSACSSSAHASLLWEEDEVLSTLGQYNVLCACPKERVVMGFLGHPYEGKWET